MSTEPQLFRVDPDSKESVKVDEVDFSRRGKPGSTINMPVDFQRCPSYSDQQSDIISANMYTAKELHQLLLKLMCDTNVAQRLIDSR